MEPLAYSIAEACTVAATGRTPLYEAIKTGKLIAHKRGRKTIIFPENLRAWVEASPQLDPAAPSNQRRHG
jgi:excisionase family DNA binding protein